MQFLNAVFVLSFIMLYTEDFSTHHYVGFSQIKSHILKGGDHGKFILSLSFKYLA